MRITIPEGPVANRIRDSLIARALIDIDPCYRSLLMKHGSTGQLAALLSLNGARQTVVFVNDDGKYWEADLTITHGEGNVLHAQYHSFRILDPVNSIGFTLDDEKLLDSNIILHILGAGIAERLNLHLEIS